MFLSVRTNASERCLTPLIEGKFSISCHIYTFGVRFTEKMLTKRDVVVVGFFHGGRLHFRDFKIHFRQSSMHVGANMALPQIRQTHIVNYSVT